MPSLHRFLITNTIQLNCTVISRSHPRWAIATTSISTLLTHTKDKGMLLTHTKDKEEVGVVVYRFRHLQLLMLITLLFLLKVTPKKKKKKTRSQQLCKTMTSLPSKPKLTLSCPFHSQEVPLNKKGWNHKHKQKIVRFQIKTKKRSKRNLENPQIYTSKNRVKVLRANGLPCSVCYFMLIDI